MNARALIGGNDDYHDLIGAGTTLRDTLVRGGIGATLHVGCGPQQTGPADSVLVMYTNGMRMAQEHQAALVARVEGGGGLVALHCSCVNTESAEWHAPWLGLIGCRFIHHPPFGRFAVSVVPGHPVTDGVEGFEVEDELYLTEVVGAPGRVLATATHEGRAHPIVTVHERGQGRVVFIALGHDHRAWQHPSFAALLTRAVRWAGSAAR